MCLLFYLHDREDAQLEVNILAAHVSSPVEIDMQVLKRLCRYLAGTVDYAVKLGNPVGDLGVIKLVVWTDSDWSGDDTSRKSQTSIHITADGAPLCGLSCRQDVISLSSCEAEWHAGARGLSEASGLRNFFTLAGVHRTPSMAVRQFECKGVGPEARRRQDQAPQHQDLLDPGLGEEQVDGDRADQRLGEPGGLGHQDLAQGAVGDVEG